MRFASRMRPAVLAMSTRQSGLESANTWRHRPQGATGSGVSATTARAVKSRAPAATAVKIATRSAQIVALREAGSMLQPEKISPAAVRTAAPTLKLE